MEKKNIILGKEIAKHVCCLKEISTTRLSMLTPIATTIKKKKKKHSIARHKKFCCKLLVRVNQETLKHTAFLLPLPASQELKLNSYCRCQRLH